jgi:hypothetical protein
MQYRFLMAGVVLVLGCSVARDEPTRRVVGAGTIAAIVTMLLNFFLGDVAVGRFVAGRS